MPLPLAGFDVIGLDVLEEEGHIGGQRERYRMQMRRGNAVGAFLVVVGIVNLATNIKDGGPGVRNAILEIVGGVMVGAAGAFVTQISI